MAAVYVSNIVINSGVDFSQSFTLEGTDSGSLFDLSQYTVDAQFRKWSGSSNYVSFNADIVSPPTAGKILLTLSAEDTSPMKAGRYVYDIVITDGIGLKTRVVEGMVLVREGVTR
jgi:hypothetical protein